MGRGSGTRAVLASLALGIACLALSGGAARAEVEYVVRWMPGDQQADGYRVHWGDRSGSYTRTIDFGSVTPDADGVRRRTILIDETRDQYVAMDAYNESGFSTLSNEIRVAAAVSCDAAACDDGNVCTVDGCSGDSCTSTPVPDGTFCGSGRACIGGSCRAVECLSGSDCDDGDACNGVERCTSGFLCASGPVPDCGNPTQCSVPACDAQSGCTRVLVPDGTPCDDRIPSTVDDRCRAGRCRGDEVDEACGDGQLDAGEECDDGNTTSGDGCSAQCTAELCGNGRLDFGEGCDDGNTASGDGCDANCAPRHCGDGSVGPGEECDDGDARSGDGCDANCTVTACGNGVLTDGEGCDDGNLEDGDGCSGLCEIEPESAPEGLAREERRCIAVVNRGVARVARAQGRVDARCFADWAAGRVERLGPAPATLESCMEADPRGKVARARERLAEQAQKRCLPEQPPQLALGADLLAGSPAAVGRATEVLSDLFGSPNALTPSDDAMVTLCQRKVTKRASRLFDAFWKTIVRAKKQKLKGRGTDPATTDAELAQFIEDALVASPALARASDRLAAAVEGSCSDAGDLSAVFPACGDDAAGLTACVDRAARCRACLLLGQADPLLSLDCDWLDDGEIDASCQP
jgi:cysteine-rich repeat protein